MTKNDLLLKSWVIISAREAASLRDYCLTGAADESDLDRALRAINNQLGWIKDHATQTASERNKLIDDAAERDSGRRNGY